MTYYNTRTNDENNAKYNAGKIYDHRQFNIVDRKSLELMIHNLEFNLSQVKADGIEETIQLICVRNGH